MNTIELDFFDIVKDFNRMGIRYLIIGRRAVVLYGAPVLTADYDFWIDSKEKDRVLSYFVKKGCSLSNSEDSINPIIHVYAGIKKIDLFFHKAIQNLEGERIFSFYCPKRESFAVFPIIPCLCLRDTVCLFILMLLLIKPD